MRLLFLTTTLLTLIAVSSLKAQTPFLLTGERGNYGLPLPIYTLYDEKNRQMVLAQNGEIRWFEGNKKPPVKTAKLKEVPRFDFSAEELKEQENARKTHLGMFGDLPENFLESSTLIQRPDGKEFCLTDRDSKFYFYSTATGELLRKVLIQKPQHKYSPKITALSNDNKIVMTQSTALDKTYVHSMETGKLLLEVSSGFLDSAGLTPDGSTLLLLHKKNVLSRFSTKTGKSSTPDFIIKSESAGNLVVSPKGDKIALSLYAKNDINGQAIIDLATNQVTLGDPTLKKFSTLAFTPDGKFLVVHQPKYMHFIETATGKHNFSYIAAYPDIWDKVVDPSFSPDSTKISFRPAHGIDIYLPYFIYCDLSQPRSATVKKLGP